MVQGVGEIVARLQAGDRLAGFVGRNTLGQAWIDGVDLSAGDPAAGEAFLSVLRHLKAQGLRTELRGDGRNIDLLERVVKEGLADRLVFDPVVPPEVYEAAFGTPLSEDDLRGGLLGRDHEAPLPKPALFKVRTACRRHMPRTDITNGVRS